MYVMLLFSFPNRVEVVIDNINIKVIAVFQYGYNAFISVILSRTVMVFYAGDWPTTPTEAVRICVYHHRVMSLAGFIAFHCYYRGDKKHPVCKKTLLPHCPE